MSGTQVIKAASMFTPSGAAAKTSVVKEMIIGAGLGTVLGFWWQVCVANQPCDSPPSAFAQCIILGAPDRLRTSTLPPPLQTYHWSENKKWDDL